MVSLTPEVAGNTIIIMGIVYIFTLVYSVYMAYLGHKQAKVYKQMEEVIKLLRSIRRKINR